ncbi:MAG: hypothetical protein IT170_02140, partial [Bryobacterales bacterium]|nr:hypothetical protein [Bryobacterales bacterium]
MIDGKSETSGVALDETGQPLRPEFTHFEDLASRLSLSLAGAALTEEAVYQGCRAAVANGVGAVLVRPSDLDLAKGWISGSGVKLTAMTGYPGGSSTTAARLYEARDVLRRGAQELALTMNLGKLVSRKFLYLESELLQMAEHCREAGARLRAVFEVDEVQQDHILIGIRLAKRTSVDVMELAFRTGNAERMAGVARYVAHHAKGKLGIAVQASDLTLDAAIALHQAGADVLVTPVAVPVAEAWRTELERRREEERKRLHEAAEAGAAA